MRTALLSTVAGLALGALAADNVVVNGRSIDLTDLKTIPTSLLSDPLYGAPKNDFDCKSDVHKNPVVMIHGLSADNEVDLNQLAWNMTEAGWCTFGITYGAHALAPWVGGITEMRESAKDLADFMKEVKEKTGADKIDLVGHSEGAVMALYVPMTQPGIAEIVEHNVCLAPAVYGAQYYGFTDLFYIGGDVTRDLVSATLTLLGAPAIDDMATGGNVYNDFQAAESISQPGNKPTIIVSNYDTLVQKNVSMVDEPSVRNVVVQDTCPEDHVGHAGLAWDVSVWGLVYNALEEDYERAFTCGQGLPF